jgi:hypothetical protein
VTSPSDAPLEPAAAPAAAPLSRARRLAAPLLIGAAVWMIALAALLHGTRGEAEARRSLTLRTGELIGWLDHDMATSCDRIGFAREGGPSDSAPAWRDVLAAGEEAAAVALSTTPRLPSLAADPRLANSLRAATEARRFTAFSRPEEMVDDPWPRRARVFARMLGNGCADRADRVAWLAGAIALASDLRSIGTLEHGAVAAEIDEAKGRSSRPTRRSSPICSRRRSGACQRRAASPIARRACSRRPSARWPTCRRCAAGGCAPTTSRRCRCCSPTTRSRASTACRRC